MPAFEEGGRSLTRKTYCSTNLIMEREVTWIVGRAGLEWSAVFSRTLSCSVPEIGVSALVCQHVYDVIHTWSILGIAYVSMWCVLGHVESDLSQKLVVRSCQVAVWSLNHSVVTHNAELVIMFICLSGECSMESRWYCPVVSSKRITAVYNFPLEIF